MSEQSRRLWRGGARGVTGVLIIAASVAVALALGSGLVPAPGIERGVVQVEVDTGSVSQFNLVCTGAFAELGADPTQPGTAVPGGESLLVIAGDPSETAELTREIPLGTPPLVLSGTSGVSLAAAELQLVQTQTLRGLTTSSCVEPAHEQWLVGGGTALGLSTTLVLGNPFAVPATVEITIFDKDGRLDAQQTAGVLVPAGAQRIVSINGYAPARDRLVVRLASTGAAVSASLGVSQTVDIRSYAVDSVTRQLSPATSLVFPAATNELSHDHNPGEGLVEDDEFPVVVRLLSPRSGGTAEVFALMPDGEPERLGNVQLEADQVAEFSVPHWPEEAEAVLVEATTPVVGGVFGTADLAPDHDYAWFAPAPLLSADREIAVPVVTGGELVLANPGSTPASVTLREAGGFETQTVSVPARTAVSVDAEGALVLRSSAPVAAGVRVVASAYLAGYPVLEGSNPMTGLTVYTR